MINNFDNDNYSIELSQYFIKCLDTSCKTLDFYLYYNPSNNTFIVSDNDISHDYKSYKTSQQIEHDLIHSDQKNFYKSDFNFLQKTIILFNKEEAYEDHEGEWQYPPYEHSNHDINFKLSLPNLQKLLLSIFKDPSLALQSYYINELFYISDLDFYFPSKTLNVEDNVDLFLIKHLNQNLLLDSALGKNVFLSQILKTKSEKYLIEFFHLLGNSENLKLKDYIFETIHDQKILEKVLHNFPTFQKFLTKNKPTDILSTKTESISIYKSHFSMANLAIIYHDKFNESSLRNCFQNILNNYLVKNLLANKDIHLHSSFYDYNNEYFVSLIENNSIIPIEKIEHFLCNCLDYISSTKYNNEMDDKNNQERITTYFNYFYQNELSLLRHQKNVKKSIAKI